MVDSEIFGAVDGSLEMLMLILKHCSQRYDCKNQRYDDRSGQ